MEKTINSVASEGRSPLKFRNYYECPHDGTRWLDDWTCACNDRCPACDAEIEPYFRDDIETIPSFVE
jgi:hypothetical protein